MFHSAKRGGGGRREDSWIISSPMKIHSHLETIPWIFPPDIIPRTIVIRVVRVYPISSFILYSQREKKRINIGTIFDVIIKILRGCFASIRVYLFSFSFLFTRHTLLIYSFFHPDEWNKDTRFSNDSTIFS